MNITDDNHSLLLSTARRYSAHLPAGRNLFFELDETLSEEGFEIKGDQDITISGGTLRALFFGLGRLLRENTFRGTDSPQKQFRGIYFATHFSNFYDNASESELRNYICDLALWGCNEICVWFDMHHYTGIDDPAAQAKIAQLRKIFQTAHSFGLHGNLLGLANEAYSTSPIEMRADWKGGKNNYRYDLSGHYHVEICPNAPGGLDLILRWRDEVCAAFEGCGVDRISINSYDQGGCVCEKCAPYGANGYWKIIPHYATIARKHFPNCHVCLATWRFDSFTDGEWSDLFKRDKELKQFVDSIDIDAEDISKIADGTPGGLPVLCFSEISMAGMLPWGGFGANPRPHAFEEEMKRCAKLVGVRPYSEGLYEDMNKIMLLSWCWKARPMNEIVGDYFAFYFGEESRENGVEAVMLLEKNMEHRTILVQDDKRRSAYSAELVNPDQEWHLEYEAPELDAERAEKALSMLESCKISSQCASSWRWRLLYLRAIIDVKLSKGECIDNELENLYQLYHATEKTIPCLIPSALPRWRKMFSKAVTEHI